LKRRLKVFKKEMSFNSCDDTIFGLLDGYLISISDSDGLCSLFVDIALKEPIELDRERIRNILEENARQYSILRAEVTATGVMVYFESSRSGFERLKEFCFFFAGQLKTLNIPGAETCSNCHKPITDISIISQNGMMHTCDKECAEIICKTEQKKAKRGRDKEPVRFFAGTTGSFLAAILAVVPFVAVAYLDIFYLWLGVITAFLVKAGYSIFGGRPSAGKGIVITLFTVLSVVVSMFLSYSVGVYNGFLNDGYVVDLIESAKLTFDIIISNNDVLMSFLTETGAAVLYSLLGLLLSIKFKKKKRKTVFVVS